MPPVRALLRCPSLCAPLLDAVQFLLRFPGPSLQTQAVLQIAAVALEANSQLIINGGNYFPANLCPSHMKARLLAPPGGAGAITSRCW